MEINTIEELIEFLRRERVSLRAHLCDGTISITFEEEYIDIDAILTATDFIRRNSPEGSDIGVVVDGVNIEISSSEPGE